MWMWLHAGKDFYIQVSIHIMYAVVWTRWYRINESTFKLNFLKHVSLVPAQPCNIHIKEVRRVQNTVFPHASH